MGSGTEASYVCQKGRRYFIVLSISDLNINMAELGIAKVFKNICGSDVLVGDSQACTPAKKPRKSPPLKSPGFFKEGLTPPGGCGGMPARKSFDF